MKFDEDNPWSVGNASVFLKYCCPECEYSHQSLNIFSNHALENHNKAQLLFAKKVKNEDSTSITIKPDLDTIYIKEEFHDGEEYLDNENLSNEDLPNESLHNETIKAKSKRIKLVKKVKDPKKNENIDKKVKCQICFLEFSNKSVMKSHTKEIHLAGKLKKCSYCDYKTSQKSWTVLKEHIDAKHPPNSIERNYICEQCSKNFKYLYSYNQHKLSHNEKIKHVCDICGTEYLSKTNFDDHMLLKHNSKDATSLVCEVCGFSTISRLKLNEHIYTKHNFEKHKQCPHCEFRHVKIQKLQIHIDAKHPTQGEKKFNCSHCPKSFMFEATLKKHIYKVKIRAMEAKKRKVSS